MERISNQDMDYYIGIRDLQGPGTLCFLWSADLHYQRMNNYDWGTKPERIKQLCRAAGLSGADFMAVAGDLVNGYYDLTNQKRDLYELSQLLNACPVPLMLTMGNHDDNAWYSSGEASRKEFGGAGNVLTKEHWYSIAMGSRMNDFVFDEANPFGGWYYRDFTRAKIRVIVLTTTDLPYIENPDKSLKYYGQWTYGFRQQQLEWLSEKALRFDEPGWAVITVTHVSYGSPELAIEGEKRPHNSDILCGIINCFCNNSCGSFSGTDEDFEAEISCDFTANPSNEFIASFNGHIHRDIVSRENNILSLSTEDIVSRNAFDVVTINRPERQIICKKHKNGPRPELDRVISY